MHLLVNNQPLFLRSMSDFTDRLHSLKFIKNCIECHGFSEMTTTKGSLVSQ